MASKRIVYITLIFEAAYDFRQGAHRVFVSDAVVHEQNDGLFSFARSDCVFEQLFCGIAALGVSRGGVPVVIPVTRPRHGLPQGGAEERPSGESVQIFIVIGEDFLYRAAAFFDIFQQGGLVRVNFVIAVRICVYADRMPFFGRAFQDFLSPFDLPSDDEKSRPDVFFFEDV